MNESQYLSLCAACDRVLLSDGPTVERVAIPWLHVIREHPIFLQNYADLFSSTDAQIDVSRKIRRFAGSTFVVAGREMLSADDPSGLWSSPNAPIGAVDVLFISHLLDVSHAGRKDDFYFGNLPADLAECGLVSAIGLIDQSGEARRELAEMWDAAVCPRVIFPPSLGYKAELGLRRRLRLESRLLQRHSKQQESGLLQRAFWRAAYEATTNWSRATLRIFEQIKALVRVTKPKTIVVTYEGHAWERLAFAAARQCHRDIICVGYQHAALFRLQHAARRSLSPVFDPDHILTAGQIGKRQFQCSSVAKNGRVSVMGSVRNGDANRSSRTEQHERKRTARQRNACLVIPEGIGNECELIFGFSIECAIACPGIQFIWRLHPLINFKTLLGRNHALKERPRNIILSQDSLEDDTSKCRWSLYRGTTAVIQAVNAGLRPLYLSRPEEMTIDPLYELKAWRERVENVEDFKNVVEHDLKNDLTVMEVEWRNAVQYCSQIFEPLDKSVLFRAVQR